MLQHNTVNPWTKGISNAEYIISCNALIIILLRVFIFDIVENKCGLQTIDYHIDIDYYPSLTSYDYTTIQPISNNMITTLNTTKVIRK